MVIFSINVFLEYMENSQWYIFVPLCLSVVPLWFHSGTTDRHSGIMTLHALWYKTYMYHSVVHICTTT